MKLRRVLGRLKRGAASRTVGLRAVAEGVASYVPVSSDPIARGLRGVTSARSSYSVWLRHLAMAHKSGIDPDPKVVAEIGPGESLGTGLAALISGCEQYFAFDVVEHAGIEKNLSIFDELVELFRERAPIPGPDEFPEVKPYLEDYAFPSGVLTEARMKRALNKTRLDKIKKSIVDQGEDSMIKYRVPWDGAGVLEKDSVDMIYSQAVLEHVDDLRGTYEAMFQWLKTGGFMSHQVDFRCHGTAREWNGHWRYSDLVWRLIRGKRAYLLNRQPHSVHLDTLRAIGFELLCDQTVKKDSRYARKHLARGFRSLSDEDLVTSGAFMLSRKTSSG